MAVYKTKPMSVNVTVCQKYFSFITDLYSKTSFKVDLYNYYYFFFCLLQFVTVLLLKVAEI